MVHFIFTIILGHTWRGRPRPPIPVEEWVMPSVDALTELFQYSVRTTIRADYTGLSNQCKPSIFSCSTWISSKYTHHNNFRMWAGILIIDFVEMGNFYDDCRFWNLVIELVILKKSLIWNIWKWLEYQYISWLT